MLAPPKKLFQILSLKKAQNVNFEWFLGPDDPFRLFSHYILCPTEPMEEEKKLRYPPFQMCLLSADPVKRVPKFPCGLRRVGHFPKFYFLLSLFLF